MTSEAQEDLSWVKKWLEKQKSEFDKTEAPKLVHLSAEIKHAMFLKVVLNPNVLRRNSNTELLEIHKQSIDLFYNINDTTGNS